MHAKRPQWSGVSSTRSLRILELCCLQGVLIVFLTVCFSSVLLGVGLLDGFRSRCIHFRLPRNQSSVNSHPIVKVPFGRSRAILSTFSCVCLGFLQKSLIFIVGSSFKRPLSLCLLQFRQSGVYVRQLFTPAGRRQF